MTRDLWKTLFLPPLFALILYLSTIYLFLPLYRRLRPRHSSSSSYLPTFLGSRFSSLIHPGRTSLSGGESLLGDEELEEGLLDNSEPVVRGGDDSERRLSRELEVGFRDESDDEEVDERVRRGTR